MGGLVRLGRLLIGRRRGMLTAVVITAAIAFPLGVIASHQFSDVPNTSIYHNDIDAIADAGVTTGCGNGTTYCPSDFVTREQMAAFMNRLGALGAGKTPVVNADKLDGLDSADFLAGATVTQGAYTCPGVTMMPTSDEADWSLASYSKYFQSGSGTFFCHVLLPDNATITGVYGLFYDASATLSGGCALRRISAANGTDQLIGSTTSSGAAFAGGIITVSDTVLSNTIVDNGAYLYVGDCVLTGASSIMRVRGLSVTYQVTGLPVW